MKYTPHPDPRHVGLWQLDGTEDVEELKAAILADRKRAAEVQGVPLRRTQATFPKLEVHRPPRSFTVPRPGKGTLALGKTIAAAVELCEQHGAEFWALGPRARVWGVKDGRYVEVGETGCVELEPTGR